MSEFSDKVRLAIKNSKLTMTYLSEVSGLSVPNLYKICQGKRLPKEKEKIFALIKALQCPKSEEQSLIKNYQIEILGRDEYFCLEAIQELLPRIGRRDSTGSYYMGEMTYPDTTVLNSKVDCSRYLQYVLMEEVKKDKQGIIKIIGGEESNYLLESIPVILQNSQVVCEHIFRLDSRSLPESDRKNVQLISSILPSIFGGFQYRPYYYYEYGRVKDNKIQLFHSAVILPDQVILLTDNYDKALILKEPEQMLMITDMFDRLQEESISMIRHVDGLDIFQKMLVKMEGENRKRTPYILTNGMQALAFLDENVLRAHLKEKSSEIEKSLKSFYSWVKQYENVPVVRFGTKSGMLSFVQTGKVEHLPENMYTPLNLEERICVLEQLKEKIRQNQAFYFINESRFNISNSLYVMAYSESDSMIGYLENQDDFCLCLLNETGITSWLYQFLRYLEDSELAFSQEEVLYYIDEMLEKLKTMI